MVKRDNELASFGAEALPGGLREINEVMRSRSPAADHMPPAPATAPLVGLIALAALWMRKGRDRS